MNKLPLSCIAFACLAAFSLAQAPVAHPFELHRIFDQAAPDREETHALSGKEGPALYVEKVSLMDENLLESTTGKASANGWEVSVVLTKDGAKRFAEITADNVGKRLGIVINGTLKSAPVIIQPITGTGLVISGTFTEQEAKDLAAKLNAAKKAGQ